MSEHSPTAGFLIQLCLTASSVRLFLSTATKAMVPFLAFSFFEKCVKNCSSIYYFNREIKRSCSIRKYRQTVKMINSNWQLFTTTSIASMTFHAVDVLATWCSSCRYLYNFMGQCDCQYFEMPTTKECVSELLQIIHYGPSNRSPMNKISIRLLFPFGCCKKFD